MTKRTALLSLLPTGLFVPLASAQTNCPAGPVSSAVPPSAWISTIKDLVNILFFLVVGALGIFSYLQARKTVFMPLKTETFKLQLKTFEDLLALLIGMRENHVDEGFDYQTIFQLNVADLMVAYAQNFFRDKIKIDDEKVQKRRQQCVAVLVKEKYLEIVSAPTKPDRRTQESEIENPAVILANWQKYEHGAIGYTVTFQERFEQLGYFLASPLLPAELKKLIEKIREASTENLAILGDVITKVAKEFPEKYPTPDDVANADFSWIWNKYNLKRKKISEYHAAIFDFISKYLNIDSILSD